MLVWLTCMRVRYRKICVKSNSLQLLPRHINLNRSAGCNLDTFFLKFHCNLAFQFSPISYCSDSANIPYTTVIGFLWYKGQFLYIGVHLKKIKLVNSKSKMDFLSCSRLSPFKELFLNQMYLQFMLKNRHGCFIPIFQTLNLISFVFTVCAHCLCIPILNKSGRMFHSRAFSWSCWSTGPLAFPFSFWLHITTWSCLKAALSYTQVWDKAFLDPWIYSRHIFSLFLPSPPKCPLTHISCCRLQKGVK